jgi:hypothetical protein
MCFRCDWDREKLGLGKYSNLLTLSVRSSHMDILDVIGSLCHVNNNTGTIPLCHLRCNASQMSVEVPTLLTFQMSVEVHTLLTSQMSLVHNPETDPVPSKDWHVIRVGIGVLKNASVRPPYDDDRWMTSSCL